MDPGLVDPGHDAHAGDRLYSRSEREEIQRSGLNLDGGILKRTLLIEKRHPMKAICFRITLVLTLTLFTMTELVAARPLPAQGPLLWQQTLIGTANGFGQAFSVAVDNQGMTGM